MGGGGEGGRGGEPQGGRGGGRRDGEECGTEGGAGDGWRERGPLLLWPDLSCSPAMRPAMEEEEDVLTDGYGSGPHQSGEGSAGDRPDGTRPAFRHNVIPAGKKGKQARKRSNKAMHKKAGEVREEVGLGRAGTRPSLQEAATEASRHLRDWATHNGWEPRRVRVGNKASRPRPAACWLVALDGMARGMLSLWDIWVATVGAFSGRPAVDCLNVPHYTGRGDATCAMGISPAIVASALRYRYAKWAFWHVKDFQVAAHPRQYPAAFQRGLQAREVRVNEEGVVREVKRLVAQVYGEGGTPWDGLAGEGALAARDRWVEEAGSGYALVEGLWRSTGEGEAVMHVVAIGHGVMIDTDWVHRVTVMRVGVERAVEALTDMAASAILVRTEYAMLAPGVEEVWRTATRAKGSQLGEKEQGLYRRAGGVARD